MTVMQVGGQLSGGWAGDRWSKRLMAAGCMLAHAAALILLASATAFWMVVAFAVLHGLAWGVRGPLMGALRADYFGSAAFGTISGFSSMILMFGMMGGPVIGGALADRRAVIGSASYCWRPSPLSDRSSSLSPRAPHLPSAPSSRPPFEYHSGDPAGGALVGVGRTPQAARRLAWVAPRRRRAGWRGSHLARWRGLLKGARPPPTSTPLAYQFVEGP